MSRFVRRSVLVAAGLMGTVMAFGPAQADTPHASRLLACAGSSPAAGRLACRHARSAQNRRVYRPIIADARPLPVEPALYGASRYASLLILGVAY